MATSDSHQYALDANGIWVYARDGFKGVPYYCDCPERHPLKLVPPSGLDGKRPFSDYFAHYGGSNCMSGGESMKHRLAKHKLRELAANLSFTMERCKNCGWTKEFHSDGHTVRIEVQSTDKCWRYDTLLSDKYNTPVFALEVRNTHASSQDKIDSTRRSIGFAEFMVDDVLRSTDGHLHNVEVVSHKGCNNCKKQKLERSGSRKETEDETYERCLREWSAREEKECEWVRQYEREQLALEASEALRVKPEKPKVEVCEMYRCYLEEIDQLQRMEISIDHGYRYLWRNQALKPKKLQFKKKPRHSGKIDRPQRIAT